MKWSMRNQCTGWVGGGAGGVGGGAGLAGGFSTTIKKFGLGRAYVGKVEVDTRTPKTELRGWGEAGEGGGRRGKAGGTGGGRGESVRVRGARRGDGGTGREGAWRPGRGRGCTQACTK